MRLLRGSVPHSDNFVTYDQEPTVEPVEVVLSVRSKPETRCAVPRGTVLPKLANRLRIYKYFLQKPSFSGSPENLRWFRERFVILGPPGIVNTISSR